MMDNNARMLRYLDNMENTLSTSSKAILDAPVHSDVIVSLDDKCESEEVSALLVTTESEADFALDKVLSSPVENSENNNSRRNACKVVVEITGKEIGMKAADFVTNSSVSPETQVFDEMFQPVFIVNYAYSHLVMFDDQLAQPCMITAFSHDQPIGRILPFDPGSRFLTTYLGGTRNCALCDVLCSLAPDILMESTLGKRLLRGKGILLVESLAFFPETQYSSNCLRTATYTISAVWSSVEEGGVIPATLKLSPPRIYDSTWVAAAGMKKKKHNGNHSWDYTMLHEQQIWDPYADIALVCAKLDCALHFLKIRVLTQNILSDTWFFSVVICSGVINCGSRNTSNLPGNALDSRGALKLHHFPFALVGNLYIVTLGGTVLVICIWDPGINPKIMNLNGHTGTLETQLLLRSTGKFCLCAYSAFMTRVWDPGRQRDISSHSTELATRAAILPWRKRLIVLLLALSAESNRMLGRRDYSVSTLYSRRAFATFEFEPENMDMVEK
ncbi:hypothetical protein A4A49_17327 [Nicotiana attenuata]|uniref:Uncharacterized protein n=1 Tax=Nicotiana attenuata TaxID=49451 RepID=A0A314KJR8_NICAT|nr:hypothetical protein A4A49_17327 [Nicotiana attenuata]